MYLCVCNALTENCVRRALSDANGGVAGVFGQHGTKPKCGKCLSNLKEYMHRFQQDKSMGEMAESG